MGQPGRGVVGDGGIILADLLDADFAFSPVEYTSLEDGAQTVRVRATDADDAVWTVRLSQEPPAAVKSSLESYVSRLRSVLGEANRIESSAGAYRLRESQGAQPQVVLATCGPLVVEIEYRVVHPNGDVRWIYALGAAARSRDGWLEQVHRPAFQGTGDAPDEGVDRGHIVCGVLATVFGVFAPLFTGLMLAMPVSFIAALGGAW